MQESYLDNNFCASAKMVICDRFLNLGKEK